MHGTKGENWKRRRRHMWPVPASGSQAPQLGVPSSSSLPLPTDSSIQSSLDYFVKDGRKIRVGDCALFQSVNAPPFIGIIRWFTTGKENCLKLCVNWLYRPADVKLVKGILLEAAPNEVFYSFHKDVISAASLLHPCKVAFLRKGVELPSGISSFVCRRVYDIENKCLWWLTDQDYTNERQEEVDKLLDKTQLEMHAALQSGGRSPKPLNGPTSTQQLKSGADSVQNSGTSFPQVKGKRRERGGDQGTEPPIKRERPSKTEDGESAGSRSDNSTKAEIAKITEKGALITTEGVEKLVLLMQLDKNERKIDLVGRILLANVIAATDRIECLGRFVQLRGVPVLDDWLQEAHKGKTGDGSSPKESDKGTEELLLALLRALDKLPVNLNALQTCNIGKSVNHLRSHKNPEIQKKARSLVDTWKKRVDAEMTKINDTKSGGSNQAVTWPVKSGFSDASHAGSRRSGSTEGTARTSITQASACKTPVGKPGQADAVVKSTPVTPGSLKLPSSLPSSVSINSKDSPGKVAGSNGNSDLPLATVKEEKSSSSSQSQNNSQSCSSDHAKTVGSSWKEDARSSTAGSVHPSKTSGGSSRHRRSSNGFSGSGVSGVQKEVNLDKTGLFNRNAPVDKLSSQSGLSSERAPDVPGADHGNSHRLIVRLPNPGRSPARSASGGSLEDPSNPGSRALSPAVPDKYNHFDRKMKLKGDDCRSHTSTDVHAESWQSNDVKEGLVGSDEGDGSPAAVFDEERRSADGTGRLDASRAACSSSGNGNGVSLIEPKSRNSFSSMNALIESCAKCSEATTPLSAGDDIGINLLANVAAGEISKSDLVSPSASPDRSSKEEPCAASNEAKSKFSSEDGGAHNSSQSDENADFVSAKQGNSVGLPPPSEKLQETSMHLLGDSKIIPSVQENKFTNVKNGSETDGANQSTMDEYKPIDCTPENVAASSIKASDLAGNSLGDGSIPVPDKKPEKLAVEKSSLCAPLIDEVSNGATLADQPRPPVAETQAEAADRINSDVIPSSSSDKIPSSENADLCNKTKSDDLTDNSLDPSGCPRKEQSATPSSNEHAGSNAVSDEVLERKEVLENHPESGGHEPPPSIPAQESETSAKSIVSTLSQADGDRLEEIARSAQASLGVATSEPDTGTKLDFDLNEGFSGEDGNQSEHLTSVVPVCSSVIRLPSLSSFAPGSMASGPPAPITVAAPAKGPFVPPENLLKSKGEPGWKGSAATSAFRPAEPRKILEMSLNASEGQSSDATAKQGRPLLDIDLNVPDERVLEDMASQSSPQTTGSESGVISNRDAPTRSAGGLDLDLNKADEGTCNGHFLASTGSRLEVPLMSVKPVSAGLPNGEASMLRDFDLNNGPGLDEVSAETLPKSHHVKNSSNMAILPPFSGLRMGNAELGNVSSWLPPGNSYPAVALPSFLGDRGEQAYPIVAAPGTQRILGSVTGAGTFGGDVYRGPVLSSSPAMAFSPASAYPYAGFPFGSSFPLPSTSLSGGCTTYVDTSSGAPSCIPAIPSQFGGPGAALSHYARPYMASLPEGSIGIGSESGRKWGRQGLDLNAGPGSADVDVKDDRLQPSASRQPPITSSQAFLEEQGRMYQVSGGIKRKDREAGSWDERFYK